MPTTKETKKSERGKPQLFTEEAAAQVEKITPTGSYILYVEEPNDASTLCIRNMSSLDVAELMDKLGDNLIEHHAHDLLLIVIKTLIEKAKQHRLSSLFTHPHEPPNPTSH